MKKINCIAIDDEPIALSIISSFCERLGIFDLKTYSDPVVGLKEVAVSKTELVFLDIEMKGINGLEIARTLPKGSCFIFTTAYMQYALDGYELDAVDFLCKPFAYDRFVAAVEKAVRRIKSIRGDMDIIVVKQDYNNVSIPIDSIIYLEAMENYTKIYRVNDNYAMPHQSLKSIAEMLPEKLFIQIHRSYIVNKSVIKFFNKKRVMLTNGTTLPVGGTFLTAVEKVFNKV